MLLKITTRAHPTLRRENAHGARWLSGTAGAAYISTAAVICVASAKAVLGTGALFVSVGWVHTIPSAVFVLVVAVFASAGLYLISMDRRDPRAVPLGIFFVLIASSFSERLLENVAQGIPEVATVALVLRRIPVDAYLAFFFWAFVRDFPRRPVPGRGFADTMLAISMAAGTLLLLANLVARFVPGMAVDWPWITRLDAEGPPYWMVVFGLAFPGLGFALMRARRVSPAERRRVQILLAGLVLGFGPSLTVVLLSVIPAVARFVERPAGLRTVGLVVYPALLSIPITTAYAVLAHQALDVRLVVRRALQYALARSTLVGAITLPFAVVAFLLYTRREERVADLVSGSTGVLLGAVLAAGMAALHLRTPLMEFLDRSFFREQYDGRVVLAALVERTREIRDTRELAGLLAGEIDRALHLSAVHTLLLDPAAGALCAPGEGPAPLSVTAPLARRLEAEGVPLEVDPERPAAWLVALPEGERSWLNAAGARLLVPVSAADGSLLGAVILGDKRSELPFTREDRQLLSTIGASVALWIENRLLARYLAHATTGDAVQEPASECTACGAVSALGPGQCPQCGDRTTEAAVPLVLAGKFRFVQRLGVGGMGVVYRAVDLSLDREVAVKTLPRMNPRAARALRREARVMAAVSHPGLALIFGAESWSGAPFLVVEYLPGGTLADRLACGPLPAKEVLDVAAALVPALGRLHASGVLHRDIKPSNIGFAADGSAKLLDFGVARVIEAARQEEPHGRPLASPPGPWSGCTTEGAEWTGTPLYLSPEAVRGGAPDPSFDLWALCMVIYESLLGRHPLAGETPQRLLLRLYDAALPDPDEFPQLPPDVQELLRNTLHRDRDRRPETACELGRRLDEVRTALPH